jgi:hypothetical protein
MAGGVGAPPTSPFSGHPRYLPVAHQGGAFGHCPAPQAELLGRAGGMPGPAHMPWNQIGPLAAPAGRAWGCVALASIGLVCGPAVFHALGYLPVREPAKSL